MARSIKKGLDYFPVDTDIFGNIQVRKLKSRYKSLGFLVYFTILCDIYKKRGISCNCRMIMCMTLLIVWEIRKKRFRKDTF